MKKLKAGLLIAIFAYLCIFSIIFSFFYSYFVAANINAYNEKFKNVQQKILVDLPSKDTYLIKIWGEQYPEKVYFNLTELAPFARRQRGKIRELYLKADQAMVNEGKNVISIINGNYYSIKVRNFYGASESRKVLITFNTFQRPAFNPTAYLQLVCLTFVTTGLLWILFYFCLKFLFPNLAFRKLALLYLIYNCWLFAAFFILIILLSLSPYRIILSAEVFINAAVFLLFLTTAAALYHFMIIYSRGLKLSTTLEKLLNRPFEISGEDKPVKAILKAYFEKLKILFLSSPDTFFISLFIFLLLQCLILTLVRLYMLAEFISYIGYFCAITGMVYRFIRLTKENDQQE